MTRVIICSTIQANRNSKNIELIEVHIDTSNVELESERLYAKCIDKNIDYAVLKGEIAKIMKELGIDVRSKV